MLHTPGLQRQVRMARGMVKQQTPEVACIRLSCRTGQHSRTQRTTTCGRLYSSCLVARKLQ